MDQETEIQIKVLSELAIECIDILHKSGYMNIGTDADYSRPDTHTTIIIRMGE